MIHAAATVWMLIIVLIAWAVHHLWVGMAKPKAVSIALFPATVLVRLGRIVGLLITGARINDSALTDAKEQGGPDIDSCYEPRVPLFGPLVVGFVPLLAVGGVLYLFIHHFESSVLAAGPQGQVSPDLPANTGALWDQLRSLITQAEGTLGAVLAIEAPRWKTAVFAYLISCLCVGLSPMPGNARGHLGAVAAVGASLALFSTISAKPAQFIESIWPLLSFAVGWLILLLFLTLIAKGCVAAVQTLLRWQP